MLWTWHVKQGTLGLIQTLRFWDPEVGFGLNSDSMVWDSGVNVDLMAWDSSQFRHWNYRWWTECRLYSLGLQSWLGLDSLGDCTWLRLIVSALLVSISCSCDVSCSSHWLHFTWCKILRIKALHSLCVNLSMSTLTCGQSLVISLSEVLLVTDTVIKQKDSKPPYRLPYLCNFISMHLLVSLPNSPITWESGSSAMRHTGNVSGQAQSL